MAKKGSKEWKENIGKGNQGKIPWNKGLTRETNEKVKQYGEKGSKTKKGHPKYTEIIRKAQKKSLLKHSILLRYSEKQAREFFENWIKSKLPLDEYAKRVNLYWGSLSKLFKHYFPDEYDLAIENKQGKQYKRGRAFEYRTKSYYEKLGYFVLRSPRSKGLLDLIAIKKNSPILLIQCKTRKTLLKDKEKAELIDLAKNLGAKAILAYRKENRRVETEDLTSIFPFFKIDKKGNIIQQGKG